MLPSDFSSFRSQYPELESTFDRLATWIKKYPSAKSIVTRRVLKELPDIDPGELSIALTLLVEAGKLKRAFAVLAPTNHVLAPGVFDTPSAIPARLHDTLDDPFDSEEGEIVPVFREVAR